MLGRAVTTVMLVQEVKLYRLELGWVRGWTGEVGLNGRSEYW